MKNLTEYQKKLYLVIGMTVLGGILLFSLNAFKADDSDLKNKVSEGNIVSPDTDFNITLDTLDSKDRSEFYRKDREEDTVLMANPFDKKKEQSSGNRILDAANQLEKEVPTRKASRKTVNEDLWDMEEEQEPSNLGLGTAQPEETEAEKRRKLLEANKLQRELYTTVSNTASSSNFSFNAAIYRDQFILPGDEVELILTEDVNYDGKVIPKNTVVFAIASINKNRVLLSLNNINHVPIALTAKDYRDGMIGIRSNRAGQLWKEASKQLQNNVVQDVTIEASQETGRIGRGIGRAITQIFRQRNYKQKDKILLVNDHQVIFATQPKSE